MRPEGVVVYFVRAGLLLKKVFEDEETAWKGPSKPKHERSAEEKALLDENLEKARLYLQPIRLEKLLSKEHSLVLNYPTSLPQIVQEYVADLEKETDNLDQEVWKFARKKLFGWVKLEMKQRGYEA